MKREITWLDLMLLVIGVCGVFFVGLHIGEDNAHNRIKSTDKTVDSLKTALQTSNEKRGRLFLALLYTDIDGKEKELDSLLIEIGKDN